jgi:short-chain fatty acids transporter
MAMSFGDELTNMLQPFWALPLLGITGLSARDILPYTLLVMVVAGAVMLGFLAFWA